MAFGIYDLPNHYSTKLPFIPSSLARATVHLQCMSAAFRLVASSRLISPLMNLVESVNTVWVTAQNVWVILTIFNVFMT